MESADTTKAHVITSHLGKSKLLILEKIELGARDPTMDVEKNRDDHTPITITAGSHNGTFSGGNIKQTEEGIDEDTAKIYILGLQEAAIDFTKF
ncbi:hypothetical protein CHS0354_033080 [Potamilus streckersoni]|uniref:Uncharacterized protein n=1 Tax=Potamilus streckersoni TaxID=2493646 RepID=A0AAE0RZ58_9BIVA|nr:hypothetical protein CHS0354_033080 [Potamilus streckersoni]